MVTRIGSPRPVVPPPHPATVTTPSPRAPERPIDPADRYAMLTVTPAHPTRYPKLVNLIDGSHDRLFLHLIHLEDADVTAALVAAAKRGVDTRIVITPHKPLGPADLAHLQELEAQGIDVVVRKQSALAESAGLSDGRAFTSRAGEPTLTTDPHTVTAIADGFARALAADVVVPHRKLLPTGRVAMLKMPEASAGPIVGALNATTKSIDLEVYQLTAPLVVDALIDAAHRGVKVRVMLEPKTVEAGNFGPMSAKLRAAGIEVKATPPKFDSDHNVDHAKFMVLDGQEMMFGTGNLVRSGLGGNDTPEANNRDFWLEDARTESVKEANELFDADWNRTPTNPADWKNLVVTPDNAEDKVFGLIDSATKRLFVYNQALQDDETMAHLLAAKARGVEVRVLLGVQPGPGGKPKNERSLQQLKAAGIDVQYYSAHYLHAKAIVADDRAFLGSQNFTNGGMENNREVGQLLDQRAVVNALVKTFLADAAHPS